MKTLYEIIFFCKWSEADGRSVSSFVSSELTDHRSVGTNTRNLSNAPYPCRGRDDTASTARVVTCTYIAAPAHNVPMNSAVSEPLKQADCETWTMAMQQPLQPERNVRFCLWGLSVLLLSVLIVSNVQSRATGFHSHVCIRFIDSLQVDLFTCISAQCCLLLFTSSSIPRRPKPASYLHLLLSQQHYIRHRHQIRSLTYTEWMPACDRKKIDDASQGLQAESILSMLKSILSWHLMFMFNAKWQFSLKSRPTVNLNEHTKKNSR